jgi:hypothetical protein
MLLATCLDVKIPWSYYFDIEILEGGFHDVEIQ